MFRLTATNVRKLFEEEMAKYEFPCQVEIKDGLPDDTKSCSGISLGNYESMGITRTKISYRKDVPDELVCVHFYPESFIANCWIDLTKSEIPRAIANGLMTLITKVGIGISKEKLRKSVNMTVAHEYRHCLQFRYMIENNLDMASYHKDEKWGIYGYGRLEKDAIAYSEGKVQPIEAVFADKRYIKKDWSWIDTIFV